MADIRPRGDRVRFVDAFLSVITRAIYQPKRVEAEYRPATSPRWKRAGNGLWRFNIGGSEWARPENRRAHKKWLKQTRKDRATLAALDAHNHSEGHGQQHHHVSDRTLRRIRERRA